MKALALAAVLTAGTPVAETVLHLSDTESVSVRPDELFASMRAEAESRFPAEAQNRVNATISAALERARQAAGVTSATGQYSVWHVEQPGRWQASQQLELHGADGAAVLALVGALQQQGLAVGQLAWRLTPETARRAEEAATRKALAAVRGRAEDAAAALGMRFGDFRGIRLDGTRPFPTPLRAMAASAGPAPAVPPSAVAENVEVSATVEAEVLLLPQ